MFLRCSLSSSAQSGFGFCPATFSVYPVQGRPSPLKGPLWLLPAWRSPRSWACSPEWDRWFSCGTRWFDNSRHRSPARIEPYSHYSDSNASLILGSGPSAFRWGTPVLSDDSSPFIPFGGALTFARPLSDLKGRLSAFCRMPPFIISAAECPSIRQPVCWFLGKRCVWWRRSVARSATSVEVCPWGWSQFGLWLTGSRFEWDLAIRHRHGCFKWEWWRRCQFSSF